MLNISAVSLLSLCLSHPISMAGLLMLNSFMISLFLLMNTNSWLFYLLILMFLGGVMVIITYMTSLAANEKMFISLSGEKLVSLIFLLAATSSLSGHMKLNLTSNYLFMKSAYEATFVFLLIGSFIILLLSMISVIKLMGLEKGPLIKRL